LKTRKHTVEELVEKCLAAFVAAGTIDLTLDQLAATVGTSKRMLIHYFGDRQTLEEQAIARLEDRLREQFLPSAFPARVKPEGVLTALWGRATAPQSRGVLLLVMDLSRRAWSGSTRARDFYHEQQRLWVELLLKYLPDRIVVEEVLQLFQGAVLAYLITGDRAPGKRALLRLISSRLKPSRHRRRAPKTSKA